MEQAQFWGVNKKLTWTKIQTRALNASMITREMMSALQQECQTYVEHQNIQDDGLEVIMDDNVLFKIILAIILNYFEVVL